MQIVRPNKAFEQTLESTFAAKYPWLLRWALHFAQNNRAAAEDLVQETFVRILLLKDTLQDLDNIEPLLYTHLRYAHLTERRRGRHHAFQSLAAVDFDTLSISLRTTAAFDQIEVQNELRKILLFLLWRRRAAKFANMFLLRFFHELSHEEIASLCLVSRHAVDLGLARARAELKTYLANPQQIRVLGRGAAPECKAQNTAVPSDRFASEMMFDIFAASFGICLDDRELERRYRAISPRPIDNDSLAHLVSCKLCLERATRICISQPPSGPSSRLARELIRQQSKGGVPRSDKKTLARIFEQGRKRMRETFDHHPSDLLIAVNTEVVAVRDISSPRAVLKVETHSATTLELVEVFSEQGFLLLMLPIASHPPFSPPELRRQVEMSGGRMLSLCVRFTCDGAWIEATYRDSLLMAEPLYDEIDAFDETPVDSSSPEGTVASAFPGGNTGQARDSLRGWSLLWQLIRRLRAFQWRVTPFVAVPAVALLVAAAAMVLTNYRPMDINAATLLRDSVSAESRLHSSHGPGAVHQKIEIKSAALSTRRDVYRDLEGRRHPKLAAADPEQQILRAELAEAQCDWNDPLSVAGFETWLDRSVQSHEDVSRVLNGLVTVTATAASGPVLRQAITIRLSDLHTVARDVVFRDHKNVEVAELSYEIVPWGPASDAWFEPLSDDTARVRSRTHEFSISTSAPQVSDDQLDLAELSVMVAIQELHSDTERLQVSRTPRGIVVSGVVESDSRKTEISNRLYTIPHVAATIWSYQDFESKSESLGAETIQAVSVASEDSPLDRYCGAQHLARDFCRQSAHQILQSSATLARESSRLRDLDAEFPSSRSLSPASRSLLDQLTKLHVQHMMAAIHEQESSLPAIGISSQPGMAAPDNPAPDFRDLVERNLKLAKELVYAEREHGRDATLILQDLSQSAWDLRAAVSHTSRSANNHPENSPALAAPQPQ